MWKFCKMLIGLGLWPLAWALSWATFQLSHDSASDPLHSGLTDWALPAGFLTWVVVFFLLPRPFRTYVLGHELTHALWALMMGARVGNMKVGKSGGHVELSKTNFLITLAPYFFPFYTALVIGAYYAAGIWINAQNAQAWWLAAIGLTWSFHLTFTLQMLSQQQPDVQEHGRIFSFTVIYIMNVLVIALLMVLLGKPTLAGFADPLMAKTSGAYGGTAIQIQRGWAFCVERLGISP